MASLKILVAWILLYLMSQVFYCEGEEYPHVSFNGVVLANHSYVNLLLVNNTESGSVQCHTDLQTCCRVEQGPHRGDWFFPNGSVLGFSSSSDDDIVEVRGPERVDLRRRNNGSASGIYHCSIATFASVPINIDDPVVQEHVCVGLYDTGGQYTILNRLLLYIASCFVGDITLPDTIEFTSIGEDSTPQFTLTCISTGGPATTVTWTRDSVPITEGTETTLDNSITAQYTHTLTMTGRLGGLYTCSVVNNKPSNDSSSLRVKGKDNMCTHHTTQRLWKCRVHAHAVASAPDSLSLKQDGETNVIVFWKVPTPLGDTTGYRVYYITDNMNEIIVDTNSSPITLTSLEPLNEYEISVVGLSEHFSSEPITSSIFLGQFIYV